MTMQVGLDQSKFQHPGGELVIDLTLAPYKQNKTRKILDLGCGSGGTADYIQNKGWGVVTGIDLNHDHVKWAQDDYPDMNFYQGDVLQVTDMLKDQFDMVSMFHLLCVVPDRQKLISQARKMVTVGGALVICDFMFLNGGNHSLEEPVAKKELKSILSDKGWKLNSAEDVTDIYCDWYQRFLDKLNKDRTEIIEYYNLETFEEMKTKFDKRYMVLKEGFMGGIIMRATAI